MKTRLFAVLTLCACGGGAIPRESLNAELVKTLCHKYAECGVVQSEAACVTQFGALDFSSYDAQIAAGKVIYDGNRARACLDSYAKTSCVDGSSTGTGQDCELTFTGTVKVGAACAEDTECVPEAFCNIVVSGTMCSATCAARVAAGGTANSSSECVRGLNLVDGKCTMPGGLGAMCTTGSACNSDQSLFCGSGGTCEKRGAEGATCSDTLPCSTFFTCSGGKCGKYVTVGQSCAATSGRAPDCQIDLFCDSTSMTCKAPQGAGAACTSSSGCTDPLRCVGPTGMMTCTAPATENASCATVPCDSKTFCETASKICKKRIAAGQACTQASSCESGSVCTGTVCQSFSNPCP